jgi:pseudouridine-5'-phosphate glycosidase
MSDPLVQLSPEVLAALDGRRPVVALESTLVTHGLPYPRNLDVARRAEARVREGAAVPATVAVRDGALRVGLSGAELEELAAVAAPGREPVPKVTRQNLAWALGEQGWSGTTVSGTMIAAHLGGIRVFATGGIGGVHRGGERSMDISADLEELARTPVAVVCAGPKSILDVGRTLEFLETRGVPVVGIGTDEVPGFWARSSGILAPSSVPDVMAAADLALRHWALGLTSGIVFAVPVPEAEALAKTDTDAAVDHAVADADTNGVHGPASTPWILARVAELTGGRSVRANVALIEHNASVAAALAVALAGARDL